MPRWQPTLSCTGQVERKLFADVGGRTVGGIVEARVHQGARDPGADVQRGAGVAGRQVSAVRAAQRLRVDGLERRIAQAERQVAEAEEQGRGSRFHQKRRRLANLRSRAGGTGGRHCGGPGQAVLWVEAAVAEAASP